MTSARISIIPEFTSKVDMLELNDDFHITDTEIVNKVTGSKILFRGIKASSGLQTANLKSIEGVTTWVLDEAEELHDQEVFDVIDESVRTLSNQNRVILIMNPTTRSHWIYKHFFTGRGVNGGENTSKDDTTYIHTTYLDNIDNLAQSWIDKAEALRDRRPEDYKNRFLGGWLDTAKGQIFSNWKLGEFVQTSSHAFGQDYGFSKDATTLVEVSIDFDRQLIYLKQHMYAHGLKTNAIYKLNKQAAGDTIIIGDLAEGRLIEELEDLGNNIERCKKGAGSIVYGINLMKNFDMIIDPSSTELIEELSNYAWLGKKDGVPMDDYNHCLDAVRYAVTYLNNDRDSGVYHLM
tara:strand:+ start:356 stop:1402 length:1047 start_codon:yes stop_codon:yes gene_type:complete